MCRYKWHILVVQKLLETEKMVIWIPPTEVIHGLDLLWTEWRIDAGPVIKTSCMTRSRRVLGWAVPPPPIFQLRLPRSPCPWMLCVATEQLPPPLSPHSGQGQGEGSLEQLSLKGRSDREERVRRRCSLCYVLTSPFCDNSTPPYGTQDC